MTTGLHERREDLSDESVNLHRAIASLMEELEAVDWYQQRVDATSDEVLRGILAHNRDEEIEHAAMVLEWLRRNHSGFDEQLRKFLFTDGPIVGREEASAEADEGGGSAGTAPGGGSLGLGGLKGRDHALIANKGRAE